MEHQQGENLEALLAKRATRGSELPWLELKVRGQIELREQARQWLKLHPRGLNVERQPLGKRVWGSLASITGARSWPVIGTALVVLAMVYLLWQLPLVKVATAEVHSLLLLTGVGVLVVVAVAVVNWPRLRQFYG